jgi:hypothetical protein
MRGLLRHWFVLSYWFGKPGALEAFQLSAANCVIHHSLVELIPLMMVRERKQAQWEEVIPRGQGRREGAPDPGDSQVRVSQD